MILCYINVCVCIYIYIYIYTHICLRPAGPASPRPRAADSFVWGFDLTTISPTILSESPPISIVSLKQNAYLSRGVTSNVVFEGHCCFDCIVGEIVVSSAYQSYEAQAAFTHYHTNLVPIWTERPVFSR